MKKYILYIFGIIAFASCEDVIEVELKDQDQEFYTVEARITPENEPWAFVSTTIPVTVDKAQEGISNAIVTISDDEIPSNTYTLIESSERAGYYTVAEGESFLGVPGRTYTMQVELPDGIILEAKETLHPVEPIDSILIFPSERGNHRFLGIFTFGKETQGLGDYYKWDIFKNGEIMFDPSSISFASDELVDGNDILGLEIFTDFHDLNEPDERQLNLGDTIYVEQTSISEFAYEFYIMMGNQANSGFLFSVPPANLPCNFTASDGSDVYGIFSANDISTSNMIIIDEAIESLLKKQ